MILPGAAGSAVAAAQPARDSAAGTSGGWIRLRSGGWTRLRSGGWTPRRRRVNWWGSGMAGASRVAVWRGRAPLGAAGLAMGRRAGRCSGVALGAHESERWGPVLGAHESQRWGLSWVRARPVWTRG